MKLTIIFHPFRGFKLDVVFQFKITVWLKRSSLWQFPMLVERLWPIKAIKQ